MVKIAKVENKQCDVCGKQNTELLEIVDPGLFVDTKIYICQSCVSKWFKAFDKSK